MIGHTRDADLASRTVWKTFPLSTGSLRSPSMTYAISAVAFLALLTGLIIIHELGHFLAARWAGVVVEEFGFGLPPRAKKLFTRAGTLFSLNWIPFGGFVRLKGENATDPGVWRTKGSFAAAPIPYRIFILVAGVLMNFCLAIVLFTFGFRFGNWIPTYVDLSSMEAAAKRGEIELELSLLIGDVVPEGGAAEASVPGKSLLVAVDGVPMTRPEEVIAYQQGKTSVRYSLLTGEGWARPEEIVVPVADGKTGVRLQTIAKRIAAPNHGIGKSLALALREAQIVTVQTVIGMGQLFVSLAQTGMVPEGITGIVGIAQLTYTSVQEGWMTYLRLVALLSLSLAVLNILPFPALDGGRLVFVLAEALRRRPTNRRFELITNSVGFAVLLLLIVLVTFADVLRLFS